MKARIHATVAVLIGKPMWECHRAADMAMFQIGERRPTTTPRGEPTEVGEYALHVQCMWRITLFDRVVTGRPDLYYPPDGTEPSDDFEWDSKGGNLQDMVIDDLFRQKKIQLRVEAVDVGEAGALHFRMRDGYALDVIPDRSAPSGGEYWRLFVPRGSEKHFIFGSNGIELE